MACRKCGGTFVCVTAGATDGAAFREHEYCSTCVDATIATVRDKLYEVRGSLAVGRADYADNSAKEALELLRAVGYLPPTYIGGGA